MKYLTVGLITVSVFCAIQAQNAKPWVEVSRSDEFFSVLMPRQPVEASQHTHVGNIDANGSRHEALADGASYTLWSSSILVWARC